MQKTDNFQLQPIGFIFTPYVETAPFRPVADAPGEFYIDIRKEYSRALFKLKEFNYIQLIFFFHLSKPHKLRVHPPNNKGREVGLFASRSPNRPNKIGSTICKLLSIKGNRIFTSGLDILNETPLLDIKPYIPDLDCRTDANSGWII